MGQMFRRWHRRLLSWGRRHGLAGSFAAADTARRRRVYHDVHQAMATLAAAPLNTTTGEETDFRWLYAVVCRETRWWWYPGWSVRRAWTRLDAAGLALVETVEAARDANIIPRVAACPAVVTDEPPAVRQARYTLAAALGLFAAAARIDADVPDPA